jgi:putative transposase
MKRFNWISHAHCLMTDHYHLLTETPDGSLSMEMRQLRGVYTQLLSTPRQRNGPLIQDKHKAILIQKDSHLLVLGVGLAWGYCC